LNIFKNLKYMPLYYLFVIFYLLGMIWPNRKTWLRSYRKFYSTISKSFVTQAEKNISIMSLKA
jgi:hypothetical protein